MNRVNDPKVIVALDFADAKSAVDLAARLDPAQCRVKIGKELYTAAGPALVERLTRHGFGVFLDLKFHDIPNTVAAACRAAVGSGVWMLNVHASGGRAMLEASRSAIPTGTGAPKLIAVTLLTSLGAADLIEIGMSGTPEEVVVRLSTLAAKCGVDGVVCSPHEAAVLRSRLGAAFLRVTPGIRLADAAADDQQRVMTPTQAMAAGASYLVIGRPITRARDPLQVLHDINRAITEDPPAV
jgi:orotidine-5'-phosphate decarboxylase